MLAKLLSKKKTLEVAPTLLSKYARAKTGVELIASPARQALVKKVKRLFSVTDEVWNNHYLYAIERFAELAQELPASEIHHHSKEGGLIDHTLEALFSGVRVTQGYILPPNQEAEKISASMDRWRFGVFIAILSHDIGKIVTDIEVVYRTHPRDQFTKWHPWFGNIPTGSEYAYRYRDRLKVSRIDKSLHEKATMSLLPKLLTKKATFWLFDDYELIGQIFNTVSHSTFGGGVISEIVRKADSSSVGSNLGAETGVKSNYSTNIPLHEKLITALRYLIQDGELKRNRPGAALWIHKEETWLVSKPAMEAAQSKLMNEGHKGIPKNVVRLYEVLREYGLLLPTKEGNSVWTCAIKDFNTNWEMNLTFLRFKNEVLWPNTEPEQFNGSITPLDKDGNPLEEALDAEQLSEKEEEPVEEPKPQKENKPIVEKNKKEVSKTSLPKRSLEQKQPDPKPPTAVVTGGKLVATYVSKKTVLPENDFITWLIKEVGTRKLRVNEKKAMVHIMDDYIALVSPSIFIDYLRKCGSLKADIYKKRAKGGPAHKTLQKEIEALNINKKSIKGQNIHELLVEGPNNQSTLKVYLLDRKMFPSMDNFTPNKALRFAD